MWSLDYLPSDKRFRRIIANPYWIGLKPLRLTVFKGYPRRLNLAKKRLKQHSEREYAISIVGGESAQRPTFLYRDALAGIGVMFPSRR